MERSEYSVEYIDTSNSFDFIDGQIIWVKIPEILYKSSVNIWHYENSGIYNTSESKILEGLSLFIDRSLIQYEHYLFRVSGEFEFGYYTEKRSCKVNGVEVNQNAEGFSVDKFWELTKTLPIGHPIKGRGLSGPPGNYVFRQGPMSEYIMNNNPILSGQLLDEYEGGYRFFVHYHTDGDIRSFNDEIMKPINRDDKISSIIS